MHNASCPILTQLDIKHFTWDIAHYLDYKVQDLAELTRSIFIDWFQDSSCFCDYQIGNKRSR